MSVNWLSPQVIVALISHTCRQQFIAMVNQISGSA